MPKTNVGMTVSLPIDLVQQIDAEVQATGFNRSRVVTAALSAYLAADRWMATHDGVRPVVFNGTGRVVFRSRAAAEEWAKTCGADVLPFKGDP